MSQHDYVIDNQDGASFRADINSALAAVVSCNSGATAPAATFAYQVWHDTATNTLKQRNGANTAWVTLLSSLGAAAAADLVTTNANLAAAQTARAWVNFNGTGAVAIRRAFNVSSITDNGIGDYTVNFTTAMSDANYVGVATSNLNSSTGYNRLVSAPYGSTPTVSAFRLVTTRGDTAGIEDQAFVSVSFFA